MTDQKPDAPGGMTAKRLRARKSKGKFLNRDAAGEIADLDQRLATRTPKIFDELVCANATQTYTECNSRIGIAVALIEGMTASARVLWMMDLSSREVQEALKDLKDTYELRMLVTSETEAPQGRMHDEEWRKRG